MAEAQDQRTEQPTPRRRQQLRLRGQVARSAHLVGAVVLLGASAGLTMVGASLAMHLRDDLERGIRVPAALELQPQRLIEQARDLLHGAFWAVLPLLGILFLFAAAANLLQVGLLIAPAAIKPQWSRMSPARALGRSFSAANLVGSVLSLLKAAAVLGLACLLVWRDLPALSQLSRLGPPQLAAYVGACLGSFALKLSAALCVIAMLDYAVQRSRHARSLRMTRHEVREDQRELEGDPLLRQRRRAARWSVWHRGRDGSDTGTVSA